MDKVSIIICVFNGEKTIKRCLNSILNQTHKNIEVIIINDGSTDNTQKIIESYDDERIKLINQSNRGLSYSRNIGIKKAKAPYILFVDADDMVSSHLVEECLKEKDNDLVIFSYLEIHHYIKIKRRVNKTFPNKNNLRQYGYVWNKMYKKSIITKNNLLFSEDIKLVEDLNFNKKYLRYVKKIGFINNELYKYNRGSSQVLSKKHYDDFLYLKEINIKDKLDIIGNDKDYKRHLYLELIKHYLISEIRNNKKVDVEKIYIKYRNQIDKIENLSLWEKYYLFMLKNKYYKLLLITTRVTVKIYDFL